MRGASADKLPNEASIMSLVCMIANWFHENVLTQFVIFVIKTYRCYNKTLHKQQCYSVDL